jgi:hypothetical protein
MSQLVKQLAVKHNIPVRIQGVLSLIQQGDCEKIIDICKNENILILGIDAFEVKGETIQPDNNLIADFSELTSKEWKVACLQAIRSAEIYFNETNGKENLWFEFSLQKS